MLAVPVRAAVRRMQKVNSANPGKTAVLCWEELAHRQSQRVLLLQELHLVPAQLLAELVQAAAEDQAAVGRALLPAAQGQAALYLPNRSLRARPAWMTSS